MKVKAIGKIYRWFADVALAFRSEMSAIVHDAGVLLFFVGLPLVYPVVYTLIYNTEDVRELPFAVVDHCRSVESRSFVRMADATAQMKLYDYAADMQEARRWLADNQVYGILEIPRDYSDNINTASQATITFYSDMSLLLRYRSFLSALTDLQLQTGAQITQKRVNMIGLPAAALSGSPVQTQTNFMGDTQQGFASFVMPGIVVLILQQSMVLGICMIAGTSVDRRRRKGMPVWGCGGHAMPSATVLGKAISYMVFYIPFTIYILHYIPVWFDLPHQGSAVDYLLFMLPFLLSSACFGIMLSYLMRQREDAFIYIVFTSLVFLFLSGLTWPRYAMNWLWHSLGACVPATWGVEGFVRINSNGAVLSEQAVPYIWLWGLSAVYFVACWILQRYMSRAVCRQDAQIRTDI